VVFGRALERPLRAASNAATTLGRGETLVPLDSAVIEANEIVAALRNAEVELHQRTEQQRLLLNELTHCVKNVLSVVQALIMRSLSEERSTSQARELVTKRLHALSTSARASHPCRLAYRSGSWWLSSRRFQLRSRDRSLSSMQDRADVRHPPARARHEAAKYGSLSSNVDIVLAEDGKYYVDAVTAKALS
jgi:HWE histidine kinase